MIGYGDKVLSMQKYKSYDLTGKVALITGASGLLGVQHAYALLESNADVILTDISDEGLKKSSDYLKSIFDPEKIQAYKMDVTRRHNIVDVAEDLYSRKVYIDILINNAAIDPKVFGENKLLEQSRFESFQENQWNLELSVGLTGAFLCCQVFGTMMAKGNKGGVILNISSDLSVISPDQRLYAKNNLPDELQPVKPVTYSIIKTGLIGLTRYLATYWANKKIRVNALSPGGVFNGQNEEFIQRISQLIPMKRMAACDEYRGAIQFLCSDASSYMTGQNIVMDGGRSVL